MEDEMQQIVKEMLTLLCIDIQNIRQERSSSGSGSRLGNVLFILYHDNDKHQQGTYGLLVDEEVQVCGKIQY
eukprot:scaffold912_cov187-Ochromonas_danica.AAC.32